ncbi:hypothetical protein ACOMHN_043809 [Nucella lapillus]
MLQDLHLPKLKIRCQQLRLTFMYKVVEGLVPAMPPSEFFTSRPQSKRRIQAKSFRDYSSTNIVERSACNNSRAFVVPRSSCEQYKRSYFVQTVVDWNQLSDQTVNSKTLSSFKGALTKEKLRD